MAKQIGAMPISGKIDNLVYYNTKNGGAVVRRAYPNLGKRVKTDKVYANTRRNNAEFGMCGYVASQLLSPILQRWKYILKPDAVGELTKKMLPFLLEDAEDPWGQRQLSSMTRYERILLTNYINALSKNPAFVNVIEMLEAGLVESTEIDEKEYILIDNLTIATVEENDNLQQRGFTELHVYVGAMTINLPEFNNRINKYQLESIFYTFGEMLNLQIVRGNDLLFPENYQVELPSFINVYDDDATVYGGVIIFTIPAKNGVEYVEEGSYYFRPIRG